MQASKHRKSSHRFPLPRSMDIPDLSSLLIYDRPQGFPRVVDGHLDVSSIPVELEPIVERNASQSPLLRMPGEIRNKIWKYVTEDLIVLVHGDREWTHLFACSDWTPTSTKRIFRLPQVCRQIYQDTCLLLYAQTMFLHHFDKTIFEWEWKEPLDPTQFALSLAQKKAIANATPMMVGSPNEYLRFLPLFPNVSRIHMDKRWRELISEKWGGFDKICWYEEWSRWPRRYMMKESDIYHILRGRDRCAYRFIKHLDLEDLDWGRIGENEERSRYRELSKVVNSYLKDHKMDWESCV